MKIHALSSKDRGQAGLSILLSVIVMLFIIGLIVMIFTLMGNSLSIATYTTATDSIANETLTTVTETGESLSVSGLRDVTCSVNEILNSSDGIIIASSNYTVNNCQIKANTSYFAKSGTVINETITGLSPAGDNFAKSTVLDAVCSLVYCTNTTTPWLPIIASENYTNATNCNIVGVTTSAYNNSDIKCSYTYTYSDRNSFNNTNWDVSYSYTREADNLATDTINDTITSISGAPDWFDIFIVITAMVVLILLTVIIITSIRGSGMIGAGQQGANQVGTA